MDIDTFLAELSSANPTPGGGSVAALETAAAAALLVMVANLTVGRKRYEEVHDQVARIRDEAAGLRDRAVSLMQEDVEAFQLVAGAMALPRGSEAERAERQTRLQEGLKGAVMPPLRTMQVASRIVELATELVDRGNRAAISDVGSAVLAAWAGYHAGRLNVDINLASIRDAAFVAEIRVVLKSIVDPDELERQVMERVMAVLGGEV